MLRRRKWARKMVTSGPEGIAAIFNLEAALVVSSVRDNFSFTS